MLSTFWVRTILCSNQIPLDTLWVCFRAECANFHRRIKLLQIYHLHKKSEISKHKERHKRFIRRELFTRKYCISDIVLFVLKLRVFAYWVSVKFFAKDPNNFLPNFGFYYSHEQLLFSQVPTLFGCDRVHCALT